MSHLPMPPVTVSFPMKRRKSVTLSITATLMRWTKKRYSRIKNLIFRAWLQYSPFLSWSSEPASSSTQNKTRELKHQVISLNAKMAEDFTRFKRSFQMEMYRVKRKSATYIEESKESARTRRILRGFRKREKK